MAKPVGSKKGERLNAQPHRTTSIGRSNNTKPKNKHARRGFKKYRGQG